MQAVKDYLSKPPQTRDYDEGIKLYQKYGLNPRLKVRIFTPNNNHLGVRNLLFYELERLVGKQPIKVQIVEDTVEEIDFKIYEIDTEIDIPKTQTVKATELPQKALKNEFPLLDFKTMPDELKILVIDRISLFNQSKIARQKLEEAATDEERLIHNKELIECMTNNQRIWEELNYYQTNKKILGKYWKLTQKSDLDKLREMTREQLFKLKQNIPTYISKARKEIRDKPDDAKVKERKTTIIDRYTYQEKEIDKLLGI